MPVIFIYNFILKINYILLSYDTSCSPLKKKLIRKIESFYVCKANCYIHISHVSTQE